ncbi:hypothetical protein Ancab_020950 [Ancistrocladus abbreviatus]
MSSSKVHHCIALQNCSVREHRRNDFCSTRAYSLNNKRTTGNVFWCKHLMPEATGWTAQKTIININTQPSLADAIGPYC